MNSKGNLSQENNEKPDLKHNDFTLRNVFDRITDAFVAFDIQWNYVYLNNKAAEIIGRKPEDLIGKNIWKEFPKKKEDIFYAFFFYSHVATAKTWQIQHAVAHLGLRKEGETHARRTPAAGHERA